MNSIDKQQREDNYQDVKGADAVQKVQDLAKGTCFFVTRQTTGEPDGVRPMSVQQVDRDGDIWFLSASDSGKNEEVAEGATVELFFGSGHTDFLHLVGHARISRDPRKIEELWEPIAKTWFTEGKDDPRITAICFTPQHGHYWESKHGSIVAGVKILFGAATGKTTDDSLQGRIEVF